MRGVRIVAQGPAGWSDSDRVFEEGTLLLTGSGEVKPVENLRQGEKLVRFTEDGHALIFTVRKIECAWLEASGL